MKTLVTFDDLKAWRAEWLEANDPQDGTDMVTPFDKYLYAAPPTVAGQAWDLPDDIAERLLAVGRVEWGTSLYQTDEKHVEDYRDTLRLTREHFATKAEETAIHGVYLEGTGIVLAHTGASPNSPQHARILTGAWNQLVEMALAAKEAGR